jgi:hypothetical protein
MMSTLNMKSALIEAISGAPKSMRCVRLKPDELHGGNDGKGAASECRKLYPDVVRRV